LAAGSSARRGGAAEKAHPLRDNGKGININI
jgi:hypothetical protein